MTGIEGKVVAITGASSGIGAATAELLAGQGARVVLGARRAGRLKALADRITAAGGVAHGEAGAHRAQTHGPPASPGTMP